VLLSLKELVEALGEMDVLLRLADCGLAPRLCQQQNVRGVPEIRWYENATFSGRRLTTQQLITPNKDLLHFARVNAVFAPPSDVQTIAVADFNATFIEDHLCSVYYVYEDGKLDQHSSTVMAEFAARFLAEQAAMGKRLPYFIGKIPVRTDELDLAAPLLNAKPVVNVTRNPGSSFRNDPIPDYSWRRRVGGIYMQTRHHVREFHKTRIQQMHASALLYSFVVEARSQDHWMRVEAEQFNAHRMNRTSYFVQH